MSPEPLVPAPHDVLASDPERERVAEALREHATAGRLDPDELDERLGAAYAARRRADLLPLLADLPAAVRGECHAPWSTEVSGTRHLIRGHDAVPLHSSIIPSAPRTGCCRTSGRSGRAR